VHIGRSKPYTASDTSNVSVGDREIVIVSGGLQGYVGEREVYTFRDMITTPEGSGKMMF
jgi:hypothetical protein